MLNEEEKPKLTNRLRRIAGQVAAVERMINEDAYCVEVLMQISAVAGAMGRVGQIVLESHLRTCVASAMRDGDDDERDEKLRELIEIFRKYAHVIE